MGKNIRVDSTGARTMLKRIRASLSEQDTILQRIGIKMLQDAQLRYRRESKGGSWPRIGFITALFRKGAKVKTPADVEKKRSKAKTLLDTGRLMASLAWNAQGSVSKIRKGRSPSVTVGTAVKYAPKHHFGQSTTFQFNEPEFRRRVSDTLGGARPPARRYKSDGRHKESGGAWVRHKAGETMARRAKKNWNPFFFKMLHGLRKLDGTSFDLPRRKILVRPGPKQMKAYARIVTNVIKEAKRA